VVSATALLHQKREDRYELQRLAKLQLSAVVQPLPAAIAPLVAGNSLHKAAKEAVEVLQAAEEAAAGGGAQKPDVAVSPSSQLLSLNLIVCRYILLFCEICFLFTLHCENVCTPFESRAVQRPSRNTPHLRSRPAPFIPASSFLIPSFHIAVL
jgi:hypothetical protein